MASGDQHNLREPKKKSIFSIRRPFSSGSKNPTLTYSPTASEEHHASRSLKERFLNRFGKNSGRDTPPNVVAPDDEPSTSPASHPTVNSAPIQNLDESSLQVMSTTATFDQPPRSSTNGSAEILVDNTPLDDRAASLSYGSHPPATSAADQDLGPLSYPQDPITTVISGQSSGPIGNTSETENNLPSAKPDAKSSIRETLELTGRILKTVLTKAPGIVDTNPAKIAVGLVNAIIAISQGVKDNKDAVAQRIALIGNQLAVVEHALRDWYQDKGGNDLHLNHFEATLREELQKLVEISDAASLRTIVDYEDVHKRIESTFVRVNEARVQLELALNIRVFKVVYKIDKSVEGLFLDRLNPSNIAHHDYILEGEEGRLLRRQVCTPGTRVDILYDIVTWATNTSSDSPNVYWLFGHAGSGKTTIAYTIARRFEFAGDAFDTIILGGNFFCSRQFQETKLSKYIIRTIVHHLALKCKPFCDALIGSGRLDTITHNLRTQLDGLLFGPWQESEAGRLADKLSRHNYLIVIDALDEIDGEGGSEFLRVLVDTISKSDEKCLKGLKFFVSSRSIPSLVAHVNSLERKKLYRLQDVRPEEASKDVATYLNASLPHLIGRPFMTQLMEHSGGLFIYAATIVKRLADRKPLDQQNFLSKVFSATDASQSSLRDPELLLNQLYTQILVDYFGDFQEEELKSRLSILYTFLCAKEPLSTTTVSGLLFPGDPAENDPEFSYLEIANDVLINLNSVLYVSERGEVLSYHKSFPDFIFDKARSGRFWCDKAMYERRLTNSCFRVMEGLRFNIANIPTSFVLDGDSLTLAEEVKRNISPTLSYACRSWGHHLSASTSTPSDTVNIHKILSDFLQIRALFWIEAMNLLKASRHCYLMLKAARDWVSQSKDDSSLAKGLSEAMSFAIYFIGSPASLSTPHLYISALATWPRRTLDPCRGWKTHFSTIPQFFNASSSGTVLMTHKVQDVHEVAFSIDGNRIASSYEGGLVVLDTLSGEKTFVRSKVYEFRVGMLTFSNDGRLIASYNCDPMRLVNNSVILWDILKGEKKLVLLGHTNWITSISFSKDGSLLASCSYDRTIRVWDIFKGDRKHVLLGHTDYVSSVIFSNDGKLIASGSVDKTVRVWDALTGKEGPVLYGHSRTVLSVMFSKDDNHIISRSEDHSIRIWDVLTGKEKHVLLGHTDHISSFSLSMDGSLLVSGSYDTTIRVWNLLEGKEIQVLRVLNETILSVAFLHDGCHIISVSAGTLWVWNVFNGEVVHILEDQTSMIGSAIFSSDNSRILSRSRDDEVLVWGIELGEKSHALPQGHMDINSVAFSSDDNHVVFGSADHSVRVWNIFKNEEKHVLRGHTNTINSVEFSNDGSLIVSSSKDNSIRLWDFMTGEVKHVLWVESKFGPVTLSKDGSLIAFGPDDNNNLVHVWDVSTAEQKYVLRGHTDCVTAIAFSNDGSLIVSGSLDRSIRVWDVLKEQQKYVLDMEGSFFPEIISVDISSDANYVVVGGQCVLVWDILKGTYKIIDWELIESIGNYAAFSCDGNLIVSGSRDNSVRIRDTFTGEQKHVLRGHTSQVRFMAFSRDGSRIVSISNDKSVRIWDISKCVLESRTPLRTFHSAVSSSNSARIVESDPERESSAVPANMPLQQPPSYRYIQKNNWLLCPQGEGYLMFVPPNERLPDDSNIHTFPSSFVSRVDFTDSTLGPDWTRCYSP